MQIFGNLTWILNLIGISTVDKEFGQILGDIVLTTSQEHTVNTLLYVSYKNYSKLVGLEDVQLFSTLLDRVGLPALHFDSTPPVESYGETYNKELLSIVQLTANIEFDELLLRTLWQRLWHNTQSPLILLLDDSANESYVASILNFCVKNSAMNVIALQPQLAVTRRNYWILRLFPKQDVIKCKFLLGYRAIFPQHLADMRGYPLRIIENTWYPQIYNYTRKHTNESVLSGFLGRTITEYAYRRNATIVNPFSLRNKFLSYAELVNTIVESNIDIGSLIEYAYDNYNISYTDIFTLSNLCFMVPVEQPIPKYRIYSYIGNKKVSVVFIVSLVLMSFLWTFNVRGEERQHELLIARFINGSVLRGLLGMPFHMKEVNRAVRKMLCLSISFASIIYVTAYLAYLQSFTINAPLVPPYKTIEDLLDGGINIALGRFNRKWFDNIPQFRNNFENFTVFSNLTEYVQLRDTLDTSYAFLVSDMWPVYEEQQKYFARPLFRLSDMCLRRNNMMALPLQRNSLYRSDLSAFIGRLTEAGLIEQWRRQSFLELLDMDWILLTDHTKPRGFEPMKLKDLRIVLKNLGGFLFVSVLCFLLELLWWKISHLRARNVREYSV
ncbi:uncharacterized protein LOC105210228 isoform X1 [Zeugodacus cucurbitae]|uniref:uncharacterized protein LOC105210228 isoform X1 n=1 Tax=Zeugodacus cucurbitae TaxID=28588 RepID=UPI0005967DD8|nr:uncharacterized protein LOC105210228 isoform X1 [Zeugodacus cucurbitae]